LQNGPSIRERAAGFALSLLQDLMTMGFCQCGGGDAALRDIHGDMPEMPLFLVVKFCQKANFKFQNSSGFLSFPFARSERKKKKK
jgi:hypothetical protein